MHSPRNDFLPNVILSWFFHILIPGDNMKKANWKTYAFWVLLAEGVGGLSGWLTRNGSKIFSQMVVKPPLTPPSIVFPIAWGILFLLMGIGAARVSLTPASGWRSLGLNLFILQLVVNFFWSPIFFNLQAYGLAICWLLLLMILVVAMILTFHKTDPPASWLQVPYLMWLVFATYLNAGVWLLNP